MLLYLSVQKNLAIRYVNVLLCWQHVEKYVENLLNIYFPIPRFFFASNEVAKGLIVKMVLKLSNLLSNLHR